MVFELMMDEEIKSRWEPGVMAENSNKLSKIFYGEKQNLSKPGSTNWRADDYTIFNPETGIGLGTAQFFKPETRAVIGTAWKLKQG